MNDIVGLLQASPGLLAVVCALLGLCVGSFLNVVIHRLPIMMGHEDQNFAHELYFPQYNAPPKVPDSERISLWHPPSTCPKCGKRIAARHNIPVLGWLLLRGRCATCSNPISVQYPIVEAITGVLCVACAWRFGFSPQLAAALFVTFVLVGLTVIDLHTMYLPEELTYLLLWGGLLASAVPVFTDGASAALGAGAGYAAMWAVARGFEVATRRDKGEAMGAGDFVLMAGLGAWLGWRALPQVILLSSLVGATVGLTLIVAGKREWTSKIPFGPYIAGAGWIAMVWGDEISRIYFQYYGHAGT